MPQRETRYPRLGGQIDRLVRSLAAVKGWDMTSTMEYMSQHTHYGRDMVHRWRQGKLRPSTETLEILVQIGKEDAGLPREWGESLLNNAHYIDAASLVNRLWGPKVIRTIPCNLPSRDRESLLGRHVEIAHLIKLLSPQYAAPLISVDGIGGVGKTALVLEVAYLCWKVSTGEELDPKVSSFEAIIFVSAKQQYLTPDGILSSSEAKRTRRDIIREIASTLNLPKIKYADPQKQNSLVREALAHQRTLLIVDNLETMKDKQEIISFLYELPPSVKVVITTREQKMLFSPIRLDQLPQEEALALIEREAQEKGAMISEEQALQLYNLLGGIPAALIFAVGQFAHGYSMETVLAKVPKVGSDVARFCFEGAVEPLLGQPAHHLLMAMSMFARPPQYVALAYAAGLANEKIAMEEGLILLQSLSLIRKQEDRYIMLPLTREYALSVLATNVTFEQEARLRWVEWYRDYVRKYGNKDWNNEWRDHYDRIEEEWENLLTVFDWCVTHERYDFIRFCWQDMHLVKFAQIYGYWDDRLFWLKWLSEAAEKRGDWSIAVKSMVDLGSTLTLMGQLDEACQVFERAFRIYKHADRPAQLLLLQKKSYLCMYQEDYTSALSWLNRAEALLDEIQLEKREHTRREADFLSYKALFFFKQKDYEQAEQFYKKMLNIARDNDQERAVAAAQIHLAFIAIAQNKLDKAEALLQEILPLHKDKRLEAFQNYTLANFYQQKGDLGTARRLAREAFEGFEYLGMKQEAQEAFEML